MDRMLTTGAPVPEDDSHKEIEPGTGMQKGYVVLSDEERAKGFVRTSYKHLKCGQITTMNIKIAETFAREPQFYSGGYCATCRTHFPNEEFVWKDTNIRVGT